MELVDPVVRNPVSSPALWHDHRTLPHLTWTGLYCLLLLLCACHLLWLGLKWQSSSGGVEGAGGKTKAFSWLATATLLGLALSVAPTS